MERKLRNHTSAQCRVVEQDNYMRFISYSTIVMHYNMRTGDLFCTGTYSQTTRKQIGWFIEEYFSADCLNYYSAKRMAEKGEKYNTFTGDFTKLTDEEAKFVHDLRYY